MTHINYNGTITTEENVRISPSNRAFRYADGLFETMKLVDGKVVLQDLHVERLYSSLEIMKFSISSFPDPAGLVKHIIELVEKNQCLTSARVRLTVFAGDTTLYDVSGRSPNYLIEAVSLEPRGFTLNERGLAVGIYRDAVKPCDIFSPVKSNNFLPYVMGAVWARENGLDESILLNQYGKVADATIANVFIVKDGRVKTPPLADGPVNGVMRKYLLKCIKDEGIPYKETSLAVGEVLEASEVFFSNVIRGIRWAERIGDSRYTNQVSAYLHSKFLVPLTG